MCFCLLSILLYSTLTFSPFLSISECISLCCRLSFWPVHHRLWKDIVVSLWICIIYMKGAFCLFTPDRVMFVHKSIKWRLFFVLTYILKNWIMFRFTESFCVPYPQHLIPSITVVPSSWSMSSPRRVINSPAHSLHQGSLCVVCSTKLDSCIHRCSCYLNLSSFISSLSPQAETEPIPAALIHAVATITAFYPSLSSFISSPPAPIPPLCSSSYSALRETSL